MRENIFSVLIFGNCAKRPTFGTEKGVGIRFFLCTSYKKLFSFFMLFPLKLASLLNYKIIFKISVVSISKLLSSTRKLKRNFMQCGYYFESINFYVFLDFLASLEFVTSQIEDFNFFSSR